MGAVQEMTICKPAVLPYFVNRATFPPDLLSLIYRKLVKQDILADLCHEQAVDEEEFTRFVDEETLLYVFMDLNNSEYVGIAWLTDIAETDCFRRATGSFSFFKEFWVPELTQMFGTMVLSQWLNILNFDLIVGFTPSSNIIAQKYCKRLGMTYHAVLPKFTCHRGKIVDGLACSITKEEFNRRIGK